MSPISIPVSVTEGIDAFTVHNSSDSNLTSSTVSLYFVITSISAASNVLPFVIVDDTTLLDAGQSA